MRRWMAAPLVFAVAAGLTTLETPRAAAQPAGPTAETLRTADGVELHGLFHATGKNPTSAPVVVFLYQPGAGNDMTKGDWSGLAKTLNNEGYHVFQFDWRGHGKSTAIKDKKKFWENPYLNGQNKNFNAFIKGGPPKTPIKTDISVKDLGANATKYLPAYLNDLAAVRVHLDSKNDNKDLNTSSIYIVGAGDAASLGMAWLAAEWNRPAVFPNVNQLGFGVAGYEYIPQPINGGIPSEAGADFGGAVWLSPTRPASILSRKMQYWISPIPMNPNEASAPKLRENNPMLFLTAEKDAAGQKQAAFFFNEMLVAEPKKGVPLERLEQTFMKDVKGGEQLQGVKLLGQNAALKTEDTIVSYFAAIQKVRQKLPSKLRKYDTPYFIDAKSFGMAP